MILNIVAFSEICLEIICFGWSMFTRFDVTMAFRNWKIVIMNKINFLIVTFMLILALILVVFSSFREMQISHSLF